MVTSHKFDHEKYFKSNIVEGLYLILQRVWKSILNFLTLGKTKTCVIYLKLEFLALYLSRLLFDFETTGVLV